MTPLVLLAACRAEDPPADGPVAPNVLVVMLDDVGVEQHAAWEILGPDPASYPVTPSLDALGSRGIRFANAYGTPLCSPSRATLLTGRYPWRHGVGSVIRLDDKVGLPDDEVLLPELLDAAAPQPWSHGWFGKWHLATDWEQPTTQGFDWYEGSIGNLYTWYASDGSAQTYDRWEKDTQGELAWTDVYATTDTVDSALEAIGVMGEPWFVGVSLNAAHEPYHFPDPATTSGRLLGETQKIQEYHAMIENADFEIGRLLDGLGAAADDTVVVVIADNGTPGDMAAGPELPARMKSSAYEMGVRVPLWVAGPGVEAGETCEALVSVADLFGTIAELAGAAPDPERPLDTVSLVPYLSDPHREPLRETVFAETFTPNGDRERQTSQRMVRDARFKLVRRHDLPDELYDLGQDPLETVDLLLGDLDEDVVVAYDALAALMPPE